MFSEYKVLAIKPDTTDALYKRPAIVGCRYHSVSTRRAFKDQQVSPSDALI